MFLNQGVTVYTRAAEKKYGVLKYIGNISEVAALARYSLGSNHLKRFPALLNTRSSSVAFGSLRPFRPVSGSNVARGSSVAFGSVD